MNRLIVRDSDEFLFLVIRMLFLIRLTRARQCAGGARARRDLGRRSLVAEPDRDHEPVADPGRDRGREPAGAGAGA